MTSSRRGHSLLILRYTLRTTVTSSVSLFPPLVQHEMPRPARRSRATASDIAALRQHFAAPCQPRDDEGADGGERHFVCNHCGGDGTATTTRMRSHLNVCPNLNYRFLPGNGFLSRAVVSERPVASPAPSTNIVSKIPWDRARREAFEFALCSAVILKGKGFNLLVLHIRSAPAQLRPGYFMLL